MQTLAMELNMLLKKEQEKFEGNYKGSPYHAIQNIIRRLDVVLTLYPNHTDLNKNLANEYIFNFNYGWAPALKPYYKDINIDIHEPFPEITSSAKQWTDNTVIESGKIAYCRQLLSYEKAGLIEIFTDEANNFTYKYKDNYPGIERYDRMSKDFFRKEIVEKIIAKKKEQNPSDYVKNLQDVNKIIKNPLRKFISYSTTEEIDNHYNKEGHYLILRLQGYDDFNTTDMFGSVEYWRYVDFVELITGVSLMHTDACIELCRREPSVDIHNLLTYTFYRDKVVRQYAAYLGRDENEISQILSCLTLSKENFDYYLEFPSTPPPMFIQVSENLLIRCNAGCQTNPFDLLNRELKRKYKYDYDKAVNKRENRFRNELFMFFNKENIIKVPREVNINFNGIKTDIDAVVFDSSTNTLGLFQLKWQDAYAESMKERYSRMTNLFPKANEWVEKIFIWLNQSSEKTIIHSLQLDSKIHKIDRIDKVCVFVISRHQMNFTGMEIDNRAAWGSWFQLIESSARIATNGSDPVFEMFKKLKAFSPVNRSKIEELPDREDFEIAFQNFEVYYKSKK